MKVSALFLSGADTTVCVSISLGLRVSAAAAEALFAISTQSHYVVCSASVLCVLQYKTGIWLQVGAICQVLLYKYIITV